MSCGAGTTRRVRAGCVTDRWGWYFELMVGCFGAHPGHDGHILGTLSGIQILVMQDALDRADTDRILHCQLILSWLAELTAVLLSLVNPDGTVAGDQFGESDSRFTYILVQCLSLIGKLDALDELYDGKGRELVLDNLVGCMNFDSAFGTEPGAESHGGQGELVRHGAAQSSRQCGCAPPRWRYWASWTGWTGTHWEDGCPRDSFLMAG
jgi:geranylgeranyl transferase type-2 subunit beta